MEALWRWTSSIFLVLALSIGDTMSQSVGPCLLPPQALQGELLRNSNPELVNSRSINNAFLYPLNGLGPGGPTTPILEGPRPANQDRLCTQCPPSQQAQLACQCNEPKAIVPISKSPINNVGLVNAQNPWVNPGPVYNIPEKLLPFSQPTPQNQFPIDPPTCLPEQNVRLPQLLPPQGPLLPFSKGLLPSTLLCSQIESTSQILPVNNQGTSVDVYSPGPIQCPLNGAPTNTFLSLPSKSPIQRLISPCPQINSLPQSIALGSQCDILPETPPCLSTGSLSSPIGATLQSSLPFSPFNMFRFPRPTIFEQSIPFQGELASSLPCSINTNSANQASVCSNSALIQQNPPTAPTTCMPNILPNLPYQNSEIVPLQSFSISQPLLNSGPGFFTPDFASINSLPPAVISPSSCAIPPIGFGSVLPQMTNFVDYSFTPLNFFPPCVEGTSPPVLPTINMPCNSEFAGLCGSSALDSVPVPINLQINVPPPFIPPPQITIINTTPIPDATVSTATDGLLDFPDSLPLVIVEGRRSRSRSWLPLILVALFASDGDCGGYGGGCSCDSGPIPIPYPIPIPTNNPVIVSN